MQIREAWRGGGKIPKPSEDQLKSNSIPFLAVVGEEDWIFREIVEKMTATTAASEMLVIPGADHMAAFMRPEFSTCILGFHNKHAGK